MPFRYGAPGQLEEMNETAAAAWHARLVRNIRASSQPPGVPFGGSRNQFFSQAEDGLAGDATFAEIAWTAFPREIQVDSATNEERWSRADASRLSQTEYCEWSVERNAAGRITRAMFTCEDRDYLTDLAGEQKDLIVDLYRRHVNPAVQRADLFDADGNYIVRNRWNTDSRNGAMHMIGGPNTIGAAIELAAGASVVRHRPDGAPLTGAQELIRCGAYGVPERHSDPTIGDGVNALARAGHFISLADPLELSFDSISMTSWETPDGSDPMQYWTYTRGAPGHHVRGVLQVPEGAGFVVGDIKIGGAEIRFGSQIADFIRIKIRGVAHRLGSATIEPVVGCISNVGGGAIPEGTLAAGRGPTRFD